jgi:hypothetical protein
VLRVLPAATVGWGHSLHGGVLVSIEGDRVIVVCAQCLTASCWHGEFMCDGSDVAGITTRTASELDALNREHPEHYSAEKVRKVCG